MHCVGTRLRATGKAVDNKSKGAKEVCEQQRDAKWSVKQGKTRQEAVSLLDGSLIYYYCNGKSGNK